MQTYHSICLGIPEVLIPRPGLDLTKWAVIACDQFTSEPEYWKKVADFVGGAPSTLNLIYPEVFLGEKNPEERIRRIRTVMESYLKKGVFVAHEGLVYVERTLGDKTRKGLMACLDLEHYDFRKGARSLIRATEGTILGRIPARVRIREGAAVELPHIMVLIDDPEDTVIGPLSESRDRLEVLYDFELMMESGHLAGYRLRDQELEKRVINSLEALADADRFAKKYGLGRGAPVLLYAMGDGNHSLATAKTIWETTKERAPEKNAVMNSPLRHALVELVNLHDPALVFEPIHRVLFDVAPGRNQVEEMRKFFEGRFNFLKLGSLQEMKAAVDAQTEDPQRIGVITAGCIGLAEVSKPDTNLPVGSLQNFLDAFLNDKGAREVDYVHGSETVASRGQNPGNMGFYLPALNKNELFRTVILDGVLPRKTFSMGEAWEKRFYLEAKKLI